MNRTPAGTGGRGPKIIRGRGTEKSEAFGRFSASVDVAQNKYGYPFLWQTFTNFNLFRYNELCGFWDVRKSKKKGIPKMKVSLKMCMKTKGKKKVPRRVCRCY